MEMLQRQTLFKQIKKYYMLIYLQDLNPYPLPKLAILLDRHRSQLSLQLQILQIHQAIQIQSKYNVANKLKNKLKPEEKVQLSYESILQKQTSQNQNNFSIIENQQFQFSKYQLNQPLLIENPKIIQLITGKIFDGKMLVKIPVQIKYGKEQMITFTINTYSKESYMDRKSYEMLGEESKLSLKNKPQQTIRVKVLIWNRENNFVVREGENEIGNDHLIEHGVMMEADFRPEVLSVQMKYTK